VQRFLRAIGASLRDHGNVSFGTFDGRHDGGALQAAKDWTLGIATLPRYAPATGLFLHGGVGNGKSQLAVCAARWLHVDRGWYSSEIVLDRWPAFLRELYQAQAEGWSASFVDRRKSARLLIIDDFADDPPTAASVRIMVEIMSERDGPTLITSNLGIEDLEERYIEVDGMERLCSRLGPACFDLVRMSGPDFRMRSRGR
jgi:DNA replication protein DnaC